MFKDNSKTTLAVVIVMLSLLAVVMVMLSLPALVSASTCLTPAEATNTDEGEKGFATAIQSDQGQGSIDCAAFIGPGGAMFEIPVTQDKLKGPVSAPIKWSVTDADADADAFVNVDVVFIGNSDGSRCTQYYKGNARSGFAAAGTKTNKNSILVACSDGFFEPEPPEPPTPPVPPTTSIDGDCSSNPDTAAFQLAIDGSEKFDWVIVGGRDVTGGGEGNTAICVDLQNTATPTGAVTNSAETDGTADSIMTRCVERCITPDAETTGVPWYEPGTPDHTNNCRNLSGPYFPIECRACELSSEVASDIFDPETQFCWEQAQQAETGSTHFPNGSFKLPPPEQGEQSWTIKGRQGSQCYLISGQTQSGYRYSYWAPSGCPN